MGSPANISANVGQVGGAPLTPGDVTGYLTQLGASLNGFTGSVSNTLNFLLAQGQFIGRTVCVGILQQSLTPTYNGGGTWCGMAQNGAGSVFTPASTGRILVMGVMTGTLNFPQATGAASTVTGKMYYAKGTSGQAFGSTTAPPSFIKLIGEPFNINWTQGLTGGNGLQQPVFMVGAVSGLVKQQSYWVDMLVSTSGSAASGGTVLVPTSVLVVEY